jgi:hypothetical protein
LDPLALTFESIFKPVREGEVMAEFILKERKILAVDDEPDVLRSLGKKSWESVRLVSFKKPLPVTRPPIS